MDLNYHKNLQYWLESIVVESQCETNQYHNHNDNRKLKKSGRIFKI